MTATLNQIQTQVDTNSITLPQDVPPTFGASQPNLMDITNISGTVATGQMLSAKMKNDFKELADNIDLQMANISSPLIQVVDMYIQQLEGAAEKAIVGPKMGAIRKGLVIERLRAKLAQDMTGNTGIVIVKLMESLFSENKRNLIDDFNKIYVNAKGCFAGCKK